MLSLVNGDLEFSWTGVFDYLWISHICCVDTFTIAFLSSSDGDL